MSEAKPASRLRLAFSCGIWMSLLAIHMFILLYVVPSFEAMWLDIGKGLPGSTDALIFVSRAARSPLGIVGSALVVLASIGILWLPWPRRRKIVLFDRLSLAVFILIAGYVAGLFLPLVEDIN